MSIYIRAAFYVARDAFLSTWTQRRMPPNIEFDPTRYYRTNQFACFRLKRRAWGCSLSRKVLRQRCLPHMAGGSEVWVDVPEKSEP